jgi:hypothetical protein
VTAASNVGSYAIAQGTVVASPNYALTYAGANLAVAPRSVTVTADAKSRIYGDANPAFTYRIGGSGLANGDTLSGTLATSATAASNVGSYAIAKGTLAASANYALTYAGANLAVAPRPIAVTADAQSKIADTLDPGLTYRIASGSLAGGDTLSGWLLRAPGETVGVFAINQGTLAATPNYALTFAGANLTITPSAAPAIPRVAPDVVALKEFGSYVKPLLAPRDPQQQQQQQQQQQAERAREPALIEGWASVCKSAQCRSLPHPDNRQVGRWIRFGSTMPEPDPQRRTAVRASD